MRAVKASRYRTIHTPRIVAIKVSTSVVYADTSQKNEDTWCKALGEYILSQIRYNPESIQGVVT